MQCSRLYDGWEKRVLIMLVVANYVVHGKSVRAGSSISHSNKKINCSIHHFLLGREAQGHPHLTELSRNKRSLKGSRGLKRSLDMLINSESAAAVITASVLVAVCTLAVIIICCRKKAGPSKMWENCKKKCRSNKVGPETAIKEAQDHVKKAAVKEAQDYAKKAAICCGKEIFGLPCGDSGSETDSESDDEETSDDEEAGDDEQGGWCCIQLSKLSNDDGSDSDEESPFENVRTNWDTTKDKEEGGSDRKSDAKSKEKKKSVTITTAGISKKERRNKPIIAKAMESKEQYRMSIITRCLKLCSRTIDVNEEAEEDVNEGDGGRLVEDLSGLADTLAGIGEEEQSIQCGCDIANDMVDEVESVGKSDVKGREKKKSVTGTTVGGAEKGKRNKPIGHKVIGSKQQDGMSSIQSCLKLSSRIVDDNGGEEEGGGEEEEEGGGEEEEEEGEDVNEGDGGGFVEDLSGLAHALVGLGEEEQSIQWDMEKEEESDGNSATRGQEKKKNKKTTVGGSEKGRSNKSSGAKVIGSEEQNGMSRLISCLKLSSRIVDDNGGEEEEGEEEEEGGGDVNEGDGGRLVEDLTGLADTLVGSGEEERSIQCNCCCVSMNISANDEDKKAHNGNSSLGKAEEEGEVENDQNEEVGVKKKQINLTNPEGEGRIAKKRDQIIDSKLKEERGREIVGGKIENVKRGEGKNKFEQMWIKIRAPCQRKPSRSEKLVIKIIDGMIDSTVKHDPVYFVTAIIDQLVINASKLAHTRTIKI